MYKYDLFRYGIKGKLALLKGLFIPGFRYTFVLRIIQYRIPVISFIFKFIWRLLSRWYGIQIEYNTKIGKGFYIGHFGTIVVNGESIIGENCNISQGVTIGRTNRGDRKGAPTIGDSVYIGANAVVVGKVNIGNNVLIAPNSFVNVDVLPNSIVLGNPCRIVPKEDATLDYINRKV